ncbi:hypothetical protein Rcae01_04758 [Novipirellula caenicola]|uniref:Uncharacterized protein n=1 Tax=Novipirellula caenicola TaxID=1536901 RepID=A0ABP9VVS5_9BACT
MTVRTSQAGGRILARRMRFGMPLRPAVEGVGVPANYAEKKFYFGCKGRLYSDCDLGFGRTRRKHPAFASQTLSSESVFWGAWLLSSD